MSLPEETEQPATSVEMESLGTEDHMHGKLLYFRTEDVDWPTGYEGAEVTLGLGIFEERTTPVTNWDVTLDPSGRP